MSFGFSVGDFLAVGNLAWTVYPSCKGLTEEFHEVCREALTVHTVIKELQDEAIDPRSSLNLRGSPRKQELIPLTKSLEEVLKELDEIIRKYQGPARRERKIWNQLRLATEDLNGIRTKLTFHVTAITAFTSSLSHGSLAQIEMVLLELVSEVRQGRRHPSLESLQEPRNDSSVRRELEAELAREGISGAEVTKHKVAIKVFVQRLLSNSNVDSAALVETASPIKPGKGEKNSETLSQIPFAIDLSPEDPARLLIKEDAKDGSLASVCNEEYDSVDEEYESADEELTTLSAGASNSTIQSGLAEISLEEVPAHCEQVPLPEHSVDLGDAHAYVDLVKAVLIHQPVTYYQCLGVMYNYRRKVFDVFSAMEWVSTLFLYYPELIQKFNAFLPDGRRVECGMVDKYRAFRLIMPFLGRFKAILARSKAFKMTAADTSRFHEAGNIIYVSGRT